MMTDYLKRCFLSQLGVTTWWHRPMRTFLMGTSGHRTPFSHARTTLFFRDLRFQNTAMKMYSALCENAAEDVSFE